MRIEGPERYWLTFDEQEFTVRCGAGRNVFSGISSTKGPKLYIASKDDIPFYIGATIQGLGSRLRYGWKANGKNGYHGYAWRKVLSEAVLDVWALRDARNQKIDLETIEAEVVFLIRSSSQWPLHQTEIHFHPSEESHRKLANHIGQHYRLT